jgi:N-acetyl sugar amidotransferase
VCNACSTHGQRPNVDWSAREKDFREVVANAKRRGGGYDCLIPVSGGKDSTWQVVSCLEHGLNPLAVTWRPPGRTEIGQRNLDNLIGLGVDHIDYSVSPAVERRFMRAALERFGTPAIPMHMALFNIPLRLGVALRIPLIVWGENSAVEYGTADDRFLGVELTTDWVKQFGVTHGTTATDWISDELSEHELTPYFGPSDDELAEAGVRAIFLGHFFEWDPERSLAVASAHGFEAPTTPRTGAYAYADIDDEFISVHHFMKWPKFGFTRTFDNLSLEIRNGRMTRDEAVAAIGERGDETPHEDIAALCDFVDISGEQFSEIVERFRNREIWSRRNGTWAIDDFLVPDWRWS